MTRTLPKLLLLLCFLAFTAAAQAQSTCTFSGGPFYNGDGSFNTTLRFRVQTVGGYVSGTFVMPSDLTYTPAASTGIVSFTRIRGATIIVAAPAHPSFVNPVTLAVPDASTYDLALIGNLSVAAPPATLGFTIIGDSSNFRASTFNITGTGVALTEDPSGQAHLVITAGGGINFSNSLSSGGVTFGDGSTLARASSKWTMDSNGRLSLSGYTPAYDQELNVLSYGQLLDVGSQAVNSGSASKQLDILRITGTLTGAPTGTSHAYLDGINFDMEVTGNPTGSGETDPVQLRGIRGEFRNNSTTGGSVRGFNLHAKAMPGSTGLVNAGAFGVTSVSTTGTDLARAIQVTSKGLTDRNIGIYFEQDSGINWKKGIDFSNAIYSIGAMYFANNQNMFVARNAAGSADIGVLALTSQDRAQFPVPVVSIGSSPFFQVGSDADNGWLFQYLNEGGSGHIRFFRQGVGSITELDSNPASGNVGLLLYVNNGATVALKQVSVGAADSCGSGFRCLRVTN